MAVPTYEAPVSFATVLAENFGCNWFRLMQDIVSKLLRATIWSSCAVLFESEQTPFSRAGRRFGSAALSRIRFRKCGFVPMSYFYSETNGWLGSKKIERSDGRCFGRQQLLANFIENFISREKKVNRSGPKFTKHKNLFDSLSVSVSQEWSREACFPQASRSLPAATATDLEMPCFCASPSESDPPELRWSAAPRILQLTLQSKPLIVFWNSLREWLRQGLELGLKLELCRLTNGL